MTKAYPYPGYCATILQKSQKFRVRVWGSYRTYRSSGYGYGSVTDLTEVPGIVARACTELTQVPGRYKNAVPASRVYAKRAYRAYRSSGYGYECRTELTEVLCRVIPGVNTPGMVLYVPYEHNLGRFTIYQHAPNTDSTGRVLGYLVSYS